MADLDFELAIRQIEGNDYDVTVVRSPAGPGHASMHFPFDGDALKTRLQALEIALLRSGGTRRQLDTEDGQAVRGFGQDLFDTLIAGDVRSRFDESLAQADQAGQPLRVRLRFEAPELAALPWEFLYDRRQPDYLVLSSDTPLVRYVEVAEVVKPLTVTGPLRILGIVASPTGMPSLDIDREKKRINDATAGLRARGLVELHWLEPATSRELQAALRREEWHIFHFAGHGGFNPALDAGVIALLDDSGGPALLPATQLGRLLGDHRPLRLALLNACEGARGSTHDLFSSTAATLVRRGTPAVVAMQYEITDDAAKEFGRSFYEAIADGSPVDLAVAEARKSVSIQMTNSLEWGTPVLFMRTPDGVLFTMQRPTGGPPIKEPSGWRQAIKAIPTRWAAIGGACALALSVLALGAGLGSGPPKPGSSPSSGASATAGGSSPGASVPIVPVASLAPVEIAVALQRDDATSRGILNGIELALVDVANTAGGRRVPNPTVITYDRGDRATGIANMTSILKRDDVIAVVGPQMSDVARGEIPLTNQAGLLQCSPSTASDDLTKPPGALTYRESHPLDINFVRTVATNASDASGAAEFVLTDLGKKRVYVVDDGVSSAKNRKQLFEAYLTAHGGVMVGAASSWKTPEQLQLIVDQARVADPEVLFFSGSSTAQQRMTEWFLATRKDFGTLPFLTSGEILTGTTFRDGAGDKATGRIFTFVADGNDFPGKAAYDLRYKAAHGANPPKYSATAHACATVILDALGRVGAASSPLDLRAKVRAAAVDPARSYDTVVGTFHFDANGDTSLQSVSVYQYSLAKRAWVANGFVAGKQ